MIKFFEYKVDTITVIQRMIATKQNPPSKVEHDKHDMVVEERRVHLIF